MQPSQVDQILSVWYSQVKNIREALRLANVSEEDINYYTFNPPEMDKLSLDQITRFYEKIKFTVIIYLFKLGLSENEIARRLGGHTRLLVNGIIKKYKEGKYEQSSPGKII